MTCCNSSASAFFRGNTRISLVAVVPSTSISVISFSTSVNSRGAPCKISELVRKSAKTFTRVPKASRVVSPPPGFSTKKSRMVVSASTAEACNKRTTFNWLDAVSSTSKFLTSVLTESTTSARPISSKEFGWPSAVILTGPWRF